MTPTAPWRVAIITVLPSLTTLYAPIIRDLGHEPVAVESYVHLLSDHVKAAHAQGWSLLEMDEGVIDDVWLRKKPKWKVYFGLPVSFAMVWRRK